MTGFLGFASIYANGLLAIFFIFVLPGLVIVRAFDIPNFPQRWLVIVLSSLTANHFLVTLIATLHLDPLQTYRAVAALLIAVLIFLGARDISASRATEQQGASILLLSDVKWLVGSLVVLGFAYFNIWKHGVPNIFQGSDVSVSWDVWSLIWSRGSFPTGSYGYPQFIPTTWATTYVFTGSTEQYFAYYTYIVLIIVPIALSMAVLGRLNWRYAVSLLFVFVWFVAEIREPWIRSTLPEGFPDWVVAIFGFCGVVLFIANPPAPQHGRATAVTALLPLCMVSIAAATKPLFGMFSIAILIAICTDAAKQLQRPERNRLIVAAIGLLAIFVTAYAIYYSHLVVRSMPSYPVTELTERLSRAAKLLNSNFSLPFRILVLIGLVLSPFLPRVRWLTLPLGVGFWLWANTASYDLRNALGLLLICAFIPLYAIARRFGTPRVATGERQWHARDGVVAAGVAVLCVVLTLPLALSDEKLKQRFANEQMSKGLGIEINQHVEKLLTRGCKIFSNDGYITTISAFKKFPRQIQFFHVVEPLNDQVVQQIAKPAGCTAILFAPGNTVPFTLNQIRTLAAAPAYVKVIEHLGVELLASDVNSPAKS